MLCQTVDREIYASTLAKRNQHRLLYCGASSFITFSSSLNGDNACAKEMYHLLNYRVRSHLLFKRLCGTKSRRCCWYVLLHFEVLLPAHDRSPWC